MRVVIKNLKFGDDSRPAPTITSQPNFNFLNIENPILIQSFLNELYTKKIQ